MGLFSKIPVWVRQLPDKDDKFSLMNLAKQGQGKFGGEREMVFCLQEFMTRQQAKAAADDARQREWKCAVIRQGVNKRYAMTATKQNYCITYENFVSDSVFFIGLAVEYEGLYNGWIASK